ncbi:MAG TPA: hypothetical protein VIM93_09030 [Kangiella sp.]
MSSRISKKEKWHQVESKGLWRYIVVVGFFKIGTLFGALGSLTSYLYDLEFEIKKLSISTLLHDYIFANFFFFILIGGIISLLGWFELKSKYSRT